MTVANGRATSADLSNIFRLKQVSPILILTFGITQPLVVISKGIWAVELCSNTVLHFLTGGGRLTKNDPYNGLCKMDVVMLLLLWLFNVPKYVHEMITKKQFHAITATLSRLKHQWYEKKHNMIKFMSLSHAHRTSLKWYYTRDVQIQIAPLHATYAAKVGCITK